MAGLPPDERYDHLIDAAKEIADAFLCGFIVWLLLAEFNEWWATVGAIAMIVAAAACLFIAACEIWTFDIERRNAPDHKRKT